ncbi:hypothetical protein B566_EDAN017601 [Ephemera danica]|nr:hypothetical protein B566_EDAN017601 [Ephemera danica]
MPLVEFDVHKAFCCDRFLAPESKSTFVPRTESLSSVPIKTRELPNIARFEKDSKPLVPISVNCRLGPPEKNHNDGVRPSSSMNAQEFAADAEPRRNRYRSHETDRDQYQHEYQSSAKWPQDRAEKNFKEVRERRSQELPHTYTSSGHRDLSNTASARMNHAYRDHTQREDARSYERYERGHNVLPPRFAAVQRERLCSTETSHRQYETSHQTHGSVANPKTHQHPHSREVQDRHSSDFPRKHKGM